MSRISIDSPGHYWVGEENEEESHVDEVDFGFEVKFSFVWSGIATGKQDLDSVRHVHVSESCQHKCSIPKSLGQYIVNHISDPEHHTLNFYLVSHILIHIKHRV